MSRYYNSEPSAFITVLISRHFICWEYADGRVGQAREIRRVRLMFLSPSSFSFHISMVFISPILISGSYIVLTSPLLQACISVHSISPLVHSPISRVLTLPRRSTSQNSSAKSDRATKSSALLSACVQGYRVLTSLR